MASNQQVEFRLKAVKKPGHPCFAADFRWFIVASSFWCLAREAVTHGADVQEILIPELLLREMKPAPESPSAHIIKRPAGFMNAAGGCLPD